MSSKVLLVVNCALDYSYANRHVLFELYRDRFDGLVFGVSKTCDRDPRFDHVVQTWSPPPLEGLCLCADAPKFTHPALLHSFHPRLVEVAWMSHDYDYVLFTEDDCLLPPRADSHWVRATCGQLEVVSPPIYYCPPTNSHWLWTRHPSVYAAYQSHRGEMNAERLRRNAQTYGTQLIPDSDTCPMFNGFCDWLIFRRQFLQEIAGDLMLMRDMWHEVAIPTTLLHRTCSIGRSNGLALWGEDRKQSLPELMRLLQQHDYVHPVKLLRYDASVILKEYQTAIDCASDPCFSIHN